MRQTQPILSHRVHLSRAPEGLAEEKTRTHDSREARCIEVTPHSQQGRWAFISGA